MMGVRIPWPDGQYKFIAGQHIGMQLNGKGMLLFNKYQEEEGNVGD